VDTKASISTRDELRRWLTNRSPEYSQAIAARAALRVLPVTFVGLSQDGVLASLVLQSCRAAFVTWAFNRLLKKYLIGA
jgi:hypothetical protein